MEKPVNIHEAKTHLSRLIERVEAGEEITLARAAATAWELSIKQASGKLKLTGSLLEDVETVGFSWLPMTAADAVAAAALPVRHRDPFDRMLVAQATRLDAILITRDPNLAAYGVEVLAAYGVVVLPA